MTEQLVKEFEELMKDCKKAQNKAFKLGLTIGIVTTLITCLLFQTT